MNKKQRRLREAKGYYTETEVQFIKFNYLYDHIKPDTNDPDRVWYDMNPIFQRPYGWTPEQEQALIRSMLREDFLGGIEWTVWEGDTLRIESFDGKRRITCLIRFFEGKFAYEDEDEYGNKRRRFYKELTDDERKLIREAKIGSITHVREAKPLSLALIDRCIALGTGTSEFSQSDRDRVLFADCPLYRLVADKLIHDPTWKKLAYELDLDDGESADYLIRILMIAGDHTKFEFDIQDKKEDFVFEKDSEDDLFFYEAFFEKAMWVADLIDMHRLHTNYTRKKNGQTRRGNTRFCFASLVLPAVVARYKAYSVRTYKDTIADVFRSMHETKSGELEGKGGAGRSGSGTHHRMASYVLNMVRPFLFT